jgi:hypothetical protein
MATFQGSFANTPRMGLFTGTFEQAKKYYPKGFVIQEILGYEWEDEANEVYDLGKPILGPRLTCNEGFMMAG